MARARRSKVASGDLFAGFTDIAEIGIGSLATVFRAQEAGTNRRVALKLLNVQDVSPRALESFDRESTALGAVSSHPHIVTLYRSFRAADQRPVLVLELCSGSVADRLHDGQGLPVQEVVALGIKVAGALETAHRAGILHQDVKPQNILITDFGEPALADFGVAVLQSSIQPTSGLFDFTTSHAAPELLEGGATSAATDVYELASTLYELAAGRAAFRAHDGESPASVILRILRDPVQPLGNARIPNQLSELLIRAMSKDKEDRPTSAAEFASELAVLEADNGWPRTRFLVPDRGEPGRSASGPTSGPVSPALAPAAERPTPGSESRPAPTGSPPVTLDAAPVPPITRDVRPRPTPRTDSSGKGDWSTPTLSTPTPTPAAQPPTAAMQAVPEPPRPEQTVRRSDLTQVAWAKPGPGSQSRGESASVAQIQPPKGPAPSPQPAHPQPADARPVVAPQVPRAPLRVDEKPELDQPTVSRGSLAQFRLAPAPIDQHTVARASLHGPAEQAPLRPQRASPPQPGAQETVMRSSLLRSAGQQYPTPPPGLRGGPTSGAPPTLPLGFPPQQPSVQQSAQPTAQLPMDLRLDPMALRRRMTIRSGTSALVIDEKHLVLRSLWRRRHIDWADVTGFEVGSDQPSESSTDGHLVAVTRTGRIDLPATRRKSADLRYLHALLDGYRQRAQMVMRGASPPWSS